MARSPKSRGSNHSRTRSKSTDELAGYFLSLTLKNVRCFGPEEQTLDLSDGNGKPARWTVILGVNGTGKTTLLQLLAGSMIISFGFEGDENVPGPRIFAQSNDPVIRRSQDSPADWTVTTCKSDSLLSIPAEVENSHCSIGAKSSSYDSESKGVDQLIWCCGYGATRRLGAPSLLEKVVDDPVRSLYSDRAELRNPEEWLLQLDYSASKPSEIQAQLIERRASITELLCKILPEISEVRWTTPGERSVNPHIEFRTPYGWVPLRQLGYGYQTMITWICDLAYRMVEKYPDSESPLEEPAVVLVDEVDLHLHPKWQRELMHYLSARFTNTQFIVTAHSPLMAQGSEDLNLAVLRREGDHVVIDNDVDNIRNWRVDQILTSDLFGLPSARPKQLDPLLERRKTLLSQSKLTAADRRELKELEVKIGGLPFGETIDEIEERREIRETLDLLMRERGLSR